MRISNRDRVSDWHWITNNVQGPNTQVVLTTEQIIHVNEIWFFLQSYHFFSWNVIGGGIIILFIPRYIRPWSRNFYSIIFWIRTSPTESTKPLRKREQYFRIFRRNSQGILQITQMCVYYTRNPTLYERRRLRRNHSI